MSSSFAYEAHAKRLAKVAAAAKPATLTRGELSRLRQAAAKEKSEPRNPLPRVTTAPLTEDPRYAAFEAAELIRVEQDALFAAESAAKAEAKRQAVSEQFFLRNERILTLHAAMEHSQVLADRQWQASVAQHQRELLRQREDKEDEAARKVEAQRAARDQGDLERQAALKAQAQTMLQEQMETMRERVREQARDEALEGQLRQWQAQEALFEEQQQAAAARRRLVDVKKQMAAEGMPRAERDRLMKVQEEAEAARAEAGKAQQEEAVQRRNAARAAVEQQKAARCEAVRKHRASQVAELKKSHRDSSDALECFGRDAVRRAERADNLRRQCLSHTQKTIDVRAKKATEARKEESAYQSFWADRNKRLDHEDEKRRQNEREVLEKVANFNQKLAAERRKRLQSDVMRELEEAECEKENILSQDRQFQSYAERCLREWEAGGKNILPLIIELKRHKDLPLRID